MTTDEAYQNALAPCRRVFLQKAADYGTAWRVLRLPSITDQLFIKAKRIRSVQDSGENQVGESIEDGLAGLVNYGLIALMLAEAQHQGADLLNDQEIPADRLEAWYDRHAQRAFELMQRKNRDYGEAWREMRIPSLVDLILMRLMRIKQIENQGGHSEASEGVEGNYLDIVNYALFALIKLKEDS